MPTPDHGPILTAIATLLRASYSAQDGPIDERTADAWRELAHRARVEMDRLISRARDAERLEQALDYARRQLASSPGAVAEIERILGSMKIGRKSACPSCVS